MRESIDSRRASLKKPLKEGASKKALALAKVPSKRPTPAQAAKAGVSWNLLPPVALPRRPSAALSQGSGLLSPALCCRARS